MYDVDPANVSAIIVTSAIYLYKIMQHYY